MLQGHCHCGFHDAGSNVFPVLVGSLLTVDWDLKDGAEACSVAVCVYMCIVYYVQSYRQQKLQIFIRTMYL